MALARSMAWVAPFRGARTAVVDGSATHLLHRVEIAPGDARPIDLSFCDELVLGQFAIAGASIPIGSSIFDARAPSRTWTTALHGFEWLRHVATAHDSDAARRARDIVLQWIARRPHHPAIAARGDVLARRVLGWLAAADALLETATDDENEIISTAWGQEVEKLRGLCAQSLEAGSLEATYALAMIGWCTDGTAGERNALDAALGRQLGLAVSPEGFHLSRDPARTLGLLLDLRALKLVHQLRVEPTPQPIEAAIQRLSAALAALRLGDGGPAFALASSLREGGRPPAGVAMRASDKSGVAAKGGYVRLSAGPLVLVADCGPPPPRPWAASACAGTLAFACSSGSAPLLRDVLGGSERIEDRTTLRANTVSVEDTSCGEFEARDDGGYDLVLDGPVEVRTGATDGRPWLEAQHSGYRRRFGVVHRRRIELAQDGSAVIGTDTLEIAEGSAGGAVVAAAAGFIPARGTALSLTADPSTIDVHLANGERWRFSSLSGPIAVEPIDRSGGMPAHPVMRIVVAFPHGTQRLVSWRFDRLSSAAAHHAPAPAGAMENEHAPPAEPVSRPRMLGTLREALARVTRRSPQS